MITLQHEFSRLQFGEAAHYRNLTLMPLLRADAAISGPGYLILEDAIGQGLARITEVNAGGSVPELRFENHADRPVLLLDGEELIGAKQNRVLNLTILAPAGRTITIPVSCVEAGRWAMHSPDLKPGDNVMYSSVRAQRVSQVTQSLRTEGTRRSNQGAVWNDLAHKAVRMQVGSPTGAMSDMYRAHAASVEDYTRAFAWREDQAGVAFAIAGRPLGLDLFDHPATMQRLFHKLVRSYVLDALDAPADKTDAACSNAFQDFLNRTAATQAVAQPAIGLGKDVRFNGGPTSGAALWAEDRYVHICAFALNEGPDQPGFRSRMSRPTRRGME